MEFLLLIKILYQTVKIAVTTDNHCLIIITVLYHRMQDKLRIDISFDSTIFEFECRLKYKDKSCLLQICIERFISWLVTDTHKCFRYFELIFQEYTKPRIINLSSLRFCPEIEILCIDKGEVIGFGLGHK